MPDEAPAEISNGDRMVVSNDAGGFTSASKFFEEMDLSTFDDRLMPEEEEFGKSHRTKRVRDLVARARRLSRTGTLNYLPNSLRDARLIDLDSYSDEIGVEDRRTSI
eukprot:CRZ01974.1 hypothetical protein [Spongospora subterranea]